MFEGKTDHMPERQSSPGEATARPETDGTMNGGAPDGGTTTGGGPATDGGPGTDRDPGTVGGTADGDATDDRKPTAEPAGDRSSSPSPAPTPSPRPTPQRVEPVEPDANPSGSTGRSGSATENAAGPPPDGESAGAGPAPAGDGPTGPTAQADAPAPRPRPEPGRVAPAAAAPTAPAAQNETVQASPSATPPSTDGPTTPTPTPSESPTVAVPRPAAAAPQAGSARAPWDTETTQVIPLSTTPPSIDPPTERLPVTAAAPPPAGHDDGPAQRGGRRRPLLIAAAVVAVLALIYVADLVVSSGSVPRGVTVAGVPVGGMSLAAAEQELRDAIEPRAAAPVAVTVGEVSAELDPSTSGLSVDWSGTLDQAGEQPLNPITRITSLFTTRELGVVTAVDREAVEGALGELAPIVNRPPDEGTVRFEGTTPVPVDPVPGQRLDQAAAIDVLEREWASGVPVALPLITLPPETTADDVATALQEVARPAVSAPVTVLGEGDTEGVLEPETIAEALSFEPGPDGGLQPVLNPTVITDALTPQLAGSERKARDAELNLATTPPSVVPSQDGRGVDYDATLADLLSVLTGTGPREITAVYSEQPAEVTTEELERLGVTGEISRFETGGFARDSGINIRRAAELVDGTIVEPGETFSLDAVTGPRTAANGYVEAGVIDNGQPDRGIAGGVSQVSTTLYNAAYFAGMTDVEHTPHSFYISRYPPGREATIASGAIDMRFRNDTPTPVLIRTNWTPSSITVTLYGTKYYEVTSTAGPRTNPTEPNTVTIPAGEPCNPSNGAPGFTITDTRTLRDLNTGEVRSQTQATRYNPSPKIVCE